VPQPRAAINLYRNWRCGERGIVGFSYDRGLGSGSFRIPGEAILDRDVIAGCCALAASRAGATGFAWRTG